jgi:hypothetical protein
MKDNPLYSKEFKLWVKKGVFCGPAPKQETPSSVIDCHGMTASQILELVRFERLKAKK